MKLYTVSCVGLPFSVPVIAPVLVLSEYPEGSEPLVKLYATVESELPATAKAVLPPAATSPREPAAVLKVGASEMFNKAVLVLTANPSGFSTLIKYVPSVPNVTLTVSCVALFLTIVLH